MINNRYATPSSGITWNFSLVTRIFSVCTLTEAYQVIQSTLADAINTVQDGKVKCNTVTYTTAFLYSDWLLS